jgi:GGDEF domain-containing protein
MVLPDCSEARAVEVAERLQATRIAGITCSIGVAEARSDDAPDSLLARADQALYRVKERGGNGIGGADEPVAADRG